MTNVTILPRQLIVLAIVLPLAAVVGYLLANPDQIYNLSAVGLVLLILAIPLLLHSHQPVLIFSWNSAIIVFFLPGQPSLWMLTSGVTLFLTVLALGLNREKHFQNVPSITWPLVFLFLVVIVTSKLTGGIGLRSLGSGVYGGKKLATVVAAMLGYFALSCQRIPREKVKRYTGMYYLSGLTTALANVIYMAGPGLWWLFLFVSVDYAISQAQEDFGMAGMDTKFSRLSGFATAGIIAYSYLLMRYGVRGLLDLKKPWRLLSFLFVFAVSLLGGFRSVLVILALMVGVQFMAERLYRTWLLPAMLGVGLLGFVFLVPLARHLPLSVQRSLSVLPIEVNAYARANAQNSTDWRVEMWQVLWPEVPKYFWRGKGYAINPTDIYLTDQAFKRGLAKDYEAAIVTGDYHSGPLSIIIPFGVWGALGFAWFLAAGWRLLYRNYRYGDPEFENVNVFLLSSFTARIIFYFIGFGAFNADMQLFAGIVGLSVAVNGGMRSEKSLAEAKVEPLPAPA